MARVRLSRFIGGLDTQSDPLVGDLSRSPDCMDMVGDTGLLRQRSGFKVLDIEPSHTKDSDGSTKGRVSLDFDGINDHLNGAGFGGQLWTKWTVRMEAPFALSGNETSGTRVFFHIAGTTYDPLKVSLIGDGSKIQVSVVVKNKAGDTVTLTSTNRSIAEWTAVVSSRYWRIVRDGTTVYLYIGPNLEDSDTLTTDVEHEVASGLSFASDTSTANYAVANLYGITIINRVLTEKECCFGIGFPTDSGEERDILGNWPCVEASGALVNDYSSYDNPLGVIGASWTNASNASSRFLLVHTHKDTDGKHWYLLGVGRRATDSTGAAPSGAIYAWAADETFYPFYFGGDSSNDDATANYDGLNFYARIHALSVLDKCFLTNGVDYAVRFNATNSTFQNMGITAPGANPYVTMSGSGGNLTAGTYRYAYTYYNGIVGVESGMSPVTEIAAAASDTATIRPFYCDDAQVALVRIYRTIAGGTVFYLLKELTNATTMSHTDTLADTNIQSQQLVTGSTYEGNLDLKRSYLPRGPQVAPTLGSSATGITGEFFYAYSWYDSATGDETGLSPVAYISVSNKQVDLSAMILPQSAFKYDKMRVYRTKTTANDFYLVATISSATTYADIITDANLTSVDFSVRALPPVASYSALFANRVWFLVGDKVYWSAPGDYEAFSWLAGSSVNPGGVGTAIHEAGGYLYAHFEDGRIYRMPHPGPQVDLSLFVPVNFREWSSKGATVAQKTIQDTPYGTIWMSVYGFYALQGDALELLSPTISPSFLNVNRVRAKYAVALYREDEETYRVWCSRGENRLNEDGFLLELKTKAWWPHTGHADAVGVLEDPKGVPHYCVGTELGYLFELLTPDDTRPSQDGDGSGTMSGSLTFVGMTNMSPTSNYTAPVGGACGAIWFRKSDGTVLQRWRVDPALLVGTGVQFYPSASEMSSGTWTVYWHGIRGYWTTMMMDFTDPRPDKTFQRLFLTHGKENAGTLSVKAAVDEGTLTTVNGQAPDLTLGMTSETSLGTASGLDNISGRYLQMEIAHDPPAAAQPVRIVDTEVEGDMAADSE